MAAEFDTQPNHTDEDYQNPDPPRQDNGDARGLWGLLALLVFAAVALLLLLTQCTARVPNTVGLTRSEAEVKLVRSGFTVGEVSELPLGSGKPGTVDEQAPLAGMIVRTGTSVDLVVATGSNLSIVPDVCGLVSANASIKLQQAGFEVEYAEEYSDTVPIGVAVSQSPPGGSRAGDGSTVTVYYSIGPQSEADVIVSRSDTNDGLSDTERDSTGSGSDPPIMNCTRAYPGASAWSSRGDIYVRLSPGGAARRVTSTGDWDTNPVIAPSHKYLIFLRAAGSGERATGVGAVCFTSFGTKMLSLPSSSFFSGQVPFYGKPVFAPSEGSTSPNTDWAVLPQFWTEDWGEEGEVPYARLLVCNVPISSAWVSWNMQFRPARTLSLGRSNRAGCVRVTQKSGAQTVFSRDFNATTGLYPH